MEEKYILLVHNLLFDLRKEEYDQGLISKDSFLKELETINESKRTPMTFPNLIALRAYCKLVGLTSNDNIKLDVYKSVGRITQKCEVKI